MNSREGVKLSIGPDVHSTELTKREVQVSVMVAAGESNKDIATAMDISEVTVKKHLTNIFDKRGLFSRTQLAIWWIHRNGTVPRSEVQALHDEIAHLKATVAMYQRTEKHRRRLAA